MPDNVTPDDVYATPIEALDLKVRTYNCLKRSAINKVGQYLDTEHIVFALGWDIPQPRS